MCSSDLAEVPIQVQPETPPTVPAAAPPVLGNGLTLGPHGEVGSWWVQVKAFRAEADANVYLAECQSRGYPAAMARIDFGAKGIFWRVRLGPYGSFEKGKQIQRQFDGGQVTDTVVLFVPLN